MGHGLKDIAFYVQKHIAPWAIICYNPGISRHAARGARICETRLLSWVTTAKVSEIELAPDLHESVQCIRQWDGIENNGFNELNVYLRPCSHYIRIQYIPRNMHTGFALLCFVVVIHWLIFPYPSGLLHWHCGNLTIAPVPAKQPWWIWINTSCEFIMNDCITTTKQSTTKPCAYFLGYTVRIQLHKLHYLQKCEIYDSQYLIR